VIRINQQNDIAFPCLIPQVIPFLGECRGIDNGGCDIVGCSYRRRESDLGQYCLYLCCDKNIFDKRGLISVSTHDAILGGMEERRPTIRLDLPVPSSPQTAILTVAISPP